MRTKEVESLTGLSKDTLRYYESLGLIMPNRDNYSRDYSQEDIDRLELIKELKSLDYSLNEIDQFIRLDQLFKDVESTPQTTLSNQDDILSFLSDKIGSSEEKIEALQVNLKKLKEMEKKLTDLNQSSNRTNNNSKVEDRFY